MSSDSRENRTVPIGTSVIGFNGEFLGVVREAYPHYLLVGREGEHDNLEVPVHSITGVVDGKLQVSVTRGAVTEVDDVETAHNLDEVRDSSEH